MKISSLGYCIKQGFKNIYRNRLFSLASVATMAACIFLFGIFFCVAQNVSYMVTEVEKNTCLTVFFDVGTSDARIESIGKTIQQMENVSLIEYTSPEEAWEKYKVKYFGDRMDLADGFEEDNPLANSASYTVYLDSAEALSTVSANVEKIDGVLITHEHYDHVGERSGKHDIAYNDSCAIPCCMVPHRKYRICRYCSPQGRDCDNEAYRS